jgi:hypothetical protein
MKVLSQLGYRLHIVKKETDDRDAADTYEEDGLAVTAM